MRNAYFKLHFSVFLFGFTAILGALIELNELALVWYRILLTTLGFAVAFGFKFPEVRRADLARLTGVGMLLVLHWLTFFGAIKVGNASVTLVCLSSSTFFTAVMEPIFRRRRLSKAELFLGVCVAAGVYVMFSVEATTWLCPALGLLSAFFAALYSVANKFLVERIPPETLNFYEIGASGAAMSLLVPMYFYIEAGTGIPVPSLRDLALLAVLSFVCTNWAYNLSISALKKISAFDYVLAVNLEPVYGVAMAAIFLGEYKDFSPRFLWGALIVMASVFSYPLLVARRKRPL
ncbi:MAG: DMT family transporter [Bacteroidia bacterium]|nr:DMT family transporter [Bacteroidia bacterium]